MPFTDVDDRVQTVLEATGVKSSLNAPVAISLHCPLVADATTSYLIAVPFNCTVTSIQSWSEGAATGTSASAACDLFDAAVDLKTLTGSPAAVTVDTEADELPVGDRIEVAVTAHADAGGCQKLLFTFYCTPRVV